MSTLKGGCSVVNSSDYHGCRVSYSIVNNYQQSNGECRQLMMSLLKDNTDIQKNFTEILHDTIKNSSDIQQRLAQSLNAREVYKQNSTKSTGADFVDTLGQVLGKIPEEKTTNKIFY